MVIPRILVPVCIAAFALGLVTAHAADPVVGQKNKRFSMERVTIPLGGTVTWRNDDATGHLVISQSPSEVFHLGMMKPGEEGAHTFTAPGSHRIICGIHPQMEMVVVVEE